MLLASEEPLIELYHTSSSLLEAAKIIRVQYTMLCSKLVQDIVVV